MIGKHIELFLVEGVPGGITTAEIAGWTGHVLSGPRSDLADLSKRPELARNGTYMLLRNDDEARGGLRCYIGKTENFVSRFRSHATKREWDQMVVISAKDDGFNEGHWGYLESRLVELAKQAARCEIDNDQIPQLRKLSEAQASDMEAFIANLQIILPVLGVNVIRTREPVSTTKNDDSLSPMFELKDVKRGVAARGQQNADEFLLLEGSQVIPAWTTRGRSESTERAYAAYRAEHARLLADGSITVEGDKATVTRDIPFGSPSRAAAISLGRSSNGRIEWTWAGGTYESWANRGLND